MGEEEGKPPEGDEGQDDEVDDKNATLSPQEFVDAILQEGEQLLVKWHKTIIKYPPKVDAFLEPANTSKNRFPNILLYDRSRVKINDKLGSDYYHASYIDSYDKIDGYVLAQAPFDDGTENDYWRLVYQERPRVIVVLSSLNTGDGHKVIRNFWPTGPKDDRSFVNDYILVRCTRTDKEKTCDMYRLVVMGPGQRGKSGLKVTLIHYHCWVEDRAVPDNLLDFRAGVKMETTKSLKEGRDGPSLLVCPSGVHRCGTFAVLDIILDRLANDKKVGLVETVSIVRKQRYGCVTNFTHYNHIADLIVRHAVSSGMVDPASIGAGRK